MKTNEEFIAGIYEKAANYIEKEETKSMTPWWKHQAVRFAAAAVFCIAFLGTGMFVFLRGAGNSEALPEQDTMMLSLLHLDGENDPAVLSDVPNLYRTVPFVEKVVLTGTVESVDVEENAIWIELDAGNEEPFTDAVGTRVSIKWDILGDIPAELATGAKVKVTGSLGSYENAASERFGSVQLTLTDAADLWIWVEHENSYRNYGGEE